MQPNFKSLIACSIFPFPSYQHHSSFYTQEHPVKKCSILAPHDVPQFGDNVEMNLVLWILNHQEFCFKLCCVSRQSLPTSCGRTNLLAYNKIVGCDDEAKKKKDLFFSSSFSFHGRRCSSQAY